MERGRGRESKERRDRKKEWYGRNQRRKEMQRLSDAVKRLTRDGGREKRKQEEKEEEEKMVWRE